MSAMSNCHYRISIKALILDDQNRFLLVREVKGMWGLPGGGLEHGETPEICLTRELREEMGLEIVSIAPMPSYFITAKSEDGSQIAYSIYKTEVTHLDFTPSDECLELRFITPDEALQMGNVFSNIVEFAELYRERNTTLESIKL